MLPRLSAVCSELMRIQVQLLQRQGAPLLLAHEGVQLLRENLPGVELTTSRDAETLKLVPKLLRASSTVLRFVPDEDALAALDALDHCAAVVGQYSAGGHVERNYNLHDVCSLLRSISVLDDCQGRLMELSELSSPSCFPSSSDGLSPSSRPTRVSTSSSHVSAQTKRFGALLVPVYTHAMQLWTLPRENASTLSILSLIDANSRVHGQSFNFPAISADQNGLLPIKAKIHMEAKMQRCRGARGLLAALRDCAFNRVDAGMSLATMARTGLYDAEVCNRSCETLYAQHALLSSQQLCQVLFHLGTLQHRHIHQKYFSSLVEPRDCNAEAMRQHVLGLAMLRQPPPSETALMNGVFLHALRTTHANRRHRDDGSSSSPSFYSHGDGERRHSGGRRLSHLSPQAQRAIQDPLNDETYTLSPQWYIDVGHGLSCLGIQHPKYKLMVARQTRRSIGCLTTAERCKLLYATGGLSAAQVPVELRAAWKSKVDRSIAITVEKLKDIEPHEGPCVMNALRYCDIREHPRIPRAPKLDLDENPMDVLLRTWSTVPKERVMQLTEQIKPQHLRTSTHKAAATALTNVVAHVAATFDDVPQEQSHRLEPLCAAVDAHSAEMTVEDTMRTLQALRKMGRTGPRQQEAVRNLLMNLWTRRYDLEGEQLTRCCACVQHWPEVPEAMELLQFAASH
ncbi:hypothetical protein ABB37_03995 [Leptomonas pyrrhocoris]|uniref:Uncharacterized protein n=1 Tax=Leptomonas pyrrhocoris TaxID=157538 RepID=A0A0N0DWD9_LEPPY|nr:hypothetical protein ABB37_03995 [Leptomonas pyrrhocoris]KPA81688.1 hypothetical protein ABB37_03995 [Leptomonas pyrrhocoris]|eukprot:XP_015660127.1 hypothetical protein ABB37_03995 [Leptomonas pyrrhocoris]